MKCPPEKIERGFKVGRWRKCRRGGECPKKPTRLGKKKGGRT